MSEFAGLNALVTGGAAGIGEVVARRLAQQGAQVAVLDRDIAGAAPHALAVQADVGVDGQVRAAVGRVAEQLGAIDILINNAGIGAQGTIADNDDDEWHQVYDVNVVGIARVTRAALPHLRRSQAAAIVNTCSIAATIGLPNRALYSATKGAVLALTRAMAADHLADGIRVNCVSPGTADTPWVARLLQSAPDPAAARAALQARQPHSRLIDPDEVADAMLYLASPRSGSTNGQVLSVDGGIGAIYLPRGTGG
ncbi:MAG: SDR family NAD(P)-dependent oxidoreductase [Beutenbergiaceae bacterium]